VIIFSSAAQELILAPFWPTAQSPLVRAYVIILFREIFIRIIWQKYGPTDSGNTETEVGRRPDCAPNAIFISIAKETGCIFGMKRQANLFFVICIGSNMNKLMKLRSLDELHFLSTVSMPEHNFT